MSEEIIYGLNAVREALRGKRQASELFLAGQPDDRRLAKLVELARERGVPIRQRQKHDLTRLCASDHHQGVALRVEPFPYANLDDILAAAADDADAVLLVLDSIQDPANLGALVRSAACAGVRGVIITRDRSTGVTPAVERVSAGAVETVPIAQVTNLVHSLEQLKERGFWIFGLTQDAPGSLFAQSLTGKVALVVGNEGEGVRPLVKKSCDLLLSIPLRGGVSSLNAAAAGAVALFETVRQRGVS
jgi:23S rRNA (guanosine2251-2'-O)-methyltransferase